MVTGVGGRQPLILSGLISGFDTGTMIQSLLAPRRQAIGEAQTQVTARQTQADAVKQVNDKLSSLLTTIKRFGDAGYVQGKAAAVQAGGASAAVSASAGPSASVAGFKVTVDRLATATRVASPNAIGGAINSAALLKDATIATPVTAGSFTVNGVSISVDPETDTLDAVMQRIRDNVPGATVSLQPDASGRPNKLRIEHAGGVTLGSGADTSNFLTSMRLLSSPGGTARTSTGNVGVTQVGAPLAQANLVTPLSQAAGSFKVNGVTISYDGAVDSLSAVLTRINNSTAGVVAAYDSATDAVTFTSRKTGSTAIALEDLGGANFLQAIGVGGATQTLGTNAQVQIDTGSGNVTYYSTTNTVADAVPGVTLTLLRESTAADTVTVSQDVSGAVSRMKEMVSGLNSAIDFIKQQTAFAETGNGPLAGDSGISRIAGQLRTLITAKIDGVTSGKTSLAELGVSYGAFGASVGTTNTLTLDEAKFKAAVESDPAGVANVLSAFRATAALNGGGSGGVQGISGDPTGHRMPGTYKITTEVNGDGTGKITATFKPLGGGATSTTTLDNVAPGSTTTGLIAGTTVTFKGAFTAGEDTVTIGTPTRGIAAKLEQFLDPLVRVDGTLDKRQDTADETIKQMKAKIDRMNDRLDRERDRLAQQFARMEVALARLNDQRSSINALSAMLGV
jgi:flagellar hook-associated protein 2